MSKKISVSHFEDFRWLLSGSDFYLSKIGQLEIIFNLATFLLYILNIKLHHERWTDSLNWYNRKLKHLYTETRQKLVEQFIVPDKY